MQCQPWLHVPKCDDQGLILCSFVFSSPYEEVDPNIYNEVYRSILAFAEVDGADILFFVMNVKEWKSSTPNSNHLEIEVLDSLNYLKPSKLRRMVIHELILGYLQNARERGWVFWIICCSVLWISSYYDKNWYGSDLILTSTLKMRDNNIVFPFSLSTTSFLFCFP